MENNTIGNDKFLKDNINNDEKLHKDLKYFQKLKDEFFEDDKNEEFFSLCSNNYKKIIKMQKEKFDKYNIRRSIKIKEEEIKKAFSKNINSRNLYVDIKNTICKEYICYDEVLYKGKEKSHLEYLINYNNDSQKGFTESCNTKYLNENIKQSFFKYIVIFLLYLLFLVGLFFKLKSIGGTMIFIRYAILATVLSILIVKIVPKIKKRRNKKKKRTINSSAELQFYKKYPLINLNAFLLGLVWKIKAVHYANNENDLQGIVHNLDLYDIVKSYENVFECSVNDIKLINIYEDRSTIKINIRCFLRLYRFTDDYKENFSNKKSSGCNNIKVTNEELLITLKALNNDNCDNDFKISEYKIL